MQKTFRRKLIGYGIVAGCALLTAAGIAATEYYRCIVEMEEDQKPLDPVLIEGLRNFYSDFGRVEETGRGGVYKVLSSSDQHLGFLYVETESISAGRPSGYAGPVEVALLTDTENRISGVLLGRHNETRGFINRIVRAVFLKRWNGLHMKALSDHKVEAVTGATLSSNAISAGVERLGSFYAGE